MKRLMDEGATELERSLLDAGSDVGSSQRGKAKLLATVAAGGLLGVGATQAVGAGKAWGAWLASSAGKASVVVAFSLAAGGGGWAVRQHLVAAAGAPTAVPASAVNSRPSATELGSALRSEPTFGAAQETSAHSATSLPVEQQNENVDSATDPGPVVSSAKDPLRSQARRAAPRVNSAPERALLEETALLENLRRAVEQKDRNLAQTLSGRYWQRFAAGQLAPEARRLDERWRVLP